MWINNNRQNSTIYTNHKVINKVIYRHFVFNLDKKGKGRHVFDDLLYKSY